MNATKILYYVSTFLLSAIFLYSAVMYFTNTEMVKSFFEGLGFPTYLIYPMAILKILGVLAIVTNKVPILREWAYAGFFFDAVLAYTAHHSTHVGQGWLAAVAAVLVIVSRVSFGINNKDRDKDLI